MNDLDPCDPLTDTEPPEDFDFMQSTWTAKYFGSCVNCPEKVRPDDEVVWVGDKVAHAVCPDGEPDLTAPHGVCPRCFLAIPASGVCGNC